jgi:hypothetical protein
MSALNDKEFIARLEELKEKDLDLFMELVLLSLKTDPDFAVEDDAPIEKKVDAMKTVVKHFEEKEEYENCAFLLELQKRIEDAEKGHVPGDE